MCQHALLQLPCVSMLLRPLSKGFLLSFLKGIFPFFWCRDAFMEAEDQAWCKRLMLETLTEEQESGCTSGARLTGGMFRGAIMKGYIWIPIHFLALIGWISNNERKTWVSEWKYLNKTFYSKYCNSNQKAAFLRSDLDIQYHVAVGQEHLAWAVSVSIIKPCGLFHVFELWYNYSE